jgi:hypothetical protein
MELIDLRVEKDGSGSVLSLEVGSGSGPNPTGSPTLEQMYQVPNARANMPIM